MARIVAHLPAEELAARHRAARDATEARHCQAIRLPAQGRTVLEAAEVLSSVPRWVEELAARHNAFGPETLGGQRRRNGRAASPLAAELLAALAERLQEPPEDGGLWSGPEVAAWMARRLGLATGASTAGLGGAAADRPVGPDTAAAPPPGGDARAAGGAGKKSGEAVAQAAAAHPDRPVEVRAEDERRPGLKPIRRRVRAPVGQRPIALGHHRHQWLHVAASVRPTSGEAVWRLRGGLSKPLFAEPLAGFAREAGAGRKRRIALVLDNAGWHGPEGLAIPDGISLVFLPPYGPALQPAERLRSLVDEPVVNRHVASLDELDTLKPHTDFQWWPKPTKPN